MSLRRTTRIKARRGAPRRTAARADGHGLPWDEVRELVFRRSAGRCEWPTCGRDLNNSGMDAHHRQPRRVGPDCPCNVVALCPEHHRHVHSRPEEARLWGFIVSAVAGELPPADKPVSVFRHGWTLLACDGTRAG